MGFLKDNNNNKILTQRKWRTRFMKLFRNFNKKDIWTIPNILCYIRILLIPLFVVLYIKAETAGDYLRAAGVILLSGTTDFLDGFIARKFDMITELGKLIDPIADKLTQTALIIVLLVRIEKMYLLLILFLAMQVFLIIAGLIFLKKDMKLDGSKWFGKISTTVFYAVMLILVAFPSISQPTINLLMSLCALFLGMSFILYIREYLSMYREAKTETQDNA